MRFSCPNPKCTGRVKLTQAKCPKCGLDLTVLALIGFYLKRLRTGALRGVATHCPSCRQWVRLSAKTCPHCGESLSVKAAVQAHLPPLRRPQVNWRKVTPPYRRWIHWLYVILSLILVGWQVSKMDISKLDASDFLTLVLRAGLCIVYVVVLIVISMWIVPRQVVHGIAHRTVPLVRFGLVCNSVSAIFFLNDLITRWAQQSLVLAAAFGAVWVAVVFIWRLILPPVREVGKAFNAAGGGSFDASEPQGRKADYD